MVQETVLVTRPLRIWFLYLRDNDFYKVLLIFVYMWTNGESNLIVYIYISPFVWIVCGYYPPRSNDLYAEVKCKGWTEDFPPLFLNVIKEVMRMRDSN